MSGYLRFVADRSERWIVWNRDNAERYPELGEAVERFDPIDRPAGRHATEWLKTRALKNHPSTVTQLMVAPGGEVGGFIAMCSGQAKLTERHRREAAGGADEYPLHPVQGVALIAWLAKDRRSDVSGRDLLAQAAAAALDVVDAGQGQIALALQAFDEETAEFWRREYGFRRSQELDGVPCLWRSLLPPPVEEA